MQIISELTFEIVSDLVFGTAMESHIDGCGGRLGTSYRLWTVVARQCRLSSQLQTLLK